jgi:hypothetical protein
MSAVKKVPEPNSQSPLGSEANLCPGEPLLLVGWFVFLACGVGGVG